MNELVGETLAGRYRIESLIGRGGMAEVYKVWDRDRSTHLALKLLREDLAEDKVFMRRFKREARTLAQLQHPHIVRFYGLEQEDIFAFMLMDFIQGTTLRREIFRTEGPLSLERVLEIMRPVCSALGYAHNSGIIHCDVKPGNIMIDGYGKVLVTDFGIARMTDAATLTMIGFGTPAYMAPELVRGENPSNQADIYSLGVILYQMLAGGERPFTGERAEISGSTSERLRWEQIHTQPISPKKWNPDISPELETTVLMCLAKDPAARPGSVIDLLNTLEEAQTQKQKKITTKSGDSPSISQVPASKVDSVVTKRHSPQEKSSRDGIGGQFFEGGYIYPRPREKSPSIEWIILVAFGTILLVMFLAVLLS